MKRFFVLMMVFVIVSCVYTTATAARNETYELNVEYDYEAAEKLLEIMNSYRESGDAWVLDSKGNKVQLGTLPTIALDESLTEAAMQRASELVVNFSHTRPDGTMCYTVNNAVLAENVGVYYSTPEEMFTAFAEEYESYTNQGHRRNMLNSKYTYVGIGAIRYGGKWYWCMDFSSKAPATENIPERRTNGTPAVITVDPESAGIKKSATASVSYIQVHVGETRYLPVIYLVMGSARVGEVDDVVWTIKDSSLASISGKQVTGLKEGNTTLQYTANGASRSVTLAVLPASNKPTAAPTASQAATPTATPTTVPTLMPSPSPIVMPSAVPTATSTAKPTAAPIAAPTATPTANPTVTPSVTPTQVPTATPTVAPTAVPIAVPTETPVVTPTVMPDATPTAKPDATSCTHAHRDTRVIKEATCCAFGSSEEYCTDCGIILNEYILARTQHDWLEEGELIREATCDKNGQINHKCRNYENCRTVTAYSDELPALGHDYQLNAEGRSVCTRCGDEDPNTIPEPCEEPGTANNNGCDHTNTASRVAEEATCWKTGVEEEYCTACGKVLSTQPIPMTDHVWLEEGELIREATCDTNGQINHKCQNFANCRNVLADLESLPPLGHDYQLNAEGRSVCTRCGIDEPVQ